MWPQKPTGGNPNEMMMMLIIIEYTSFPWQSPTPIPPFGPPQLNCHHLQTHQERAPENEWLDIQPHPVFSQDGDSFLLLAGIQETGTEHFTHIKHVTITQQRMSVISHGRYEVSGGVGGKQEDEST